MAAQLVKNLLYIAIFSVTKKNQLNHCEHDFSSTNLSLRIQKLILTFSTSELVLSNSLDYSNSFDIVSHTFLLILGACGLCVRLTGFVFIEVSVSRILSSSFGLLCYYTLLKLHKINIPVVLDTPLFLLMTNVSWRQ
jgi:hypothetical protein